jgi:hypothetical protein
MKKIEPPRPVTTPAMKTLENEAVALARQNAGQMTPALYQPGAMVKMTKERAVAQALESNPEVYEQYRQQHNAADMVRRLQAAGYELVQR